MRIVGISAFYHDSAAALVEDGRIVAAAQEERFTRRKHDSQFPAQALAYCVREWATTSVAIGTGNRLEVSKEIHFPHSLGLLYSAFTYYTGFKVNSGEYKVMGLAPYGEPRFAGLIKKHLIDIKDDGSFRLNLDYFDYCTGLTMTNKKFDALFGGPRRTSEDRLTQREMDL